MSDFLSQLKHHLTEEIEHVLPSQSFRVEVYEKWQSDEIAIHTVYECEGLPRVVSKRVPYGGRDVMEFRRSQYSSPEGKLLLVMMAGEGHRPPSSEELQDKWVLTEFGRQLAHRIASEIKETLGPQTKKEKFVCKSDGPHYTYGVESKGTI